MLLISDLHQLHLSCPAIEREGDPLLRQGGMWAVGHRQNRDVHGVVSEFPVFATTLDLPVHWKVKA